MKKFSFSTVLALAITILIIGGLIFTVGRYVAVKNKKQYAETTIGAAKNISIRELAKNKKIITNVDEGYSFVSPENWYIESSGNTVSLYPDYAPNTGTDPQCKIELSTFLNPKNNSLNTWIDAQLSEDPTLEIKETSVDGSNVNGLTEMTWTGVIDGMQTMLEYIASEGKIYELAPSSLDASETDQSSCANYLPGITSTFHIN